MIELDPLTGLPTVADGIHEVYRQKLGNPLARHYGIAIRQFGSATFFDLQKDVGPRVLSFREFSEGLRVFVTQSIPPGAQMELARTRLHEARASFAEWALLENNCEHWASYVIRGKRQSGQIRDAGVLIVVAAAVLAFRE